MTKKVKIEVNRKAGKELAREIGKNLKRKHGKNVQIDENELAKELQKTIDKAFK